MMRLGAHSGSHGGPHRPLGVRLTAVDVATLIGAALLVAFISAIGGTGLGL